MAKSPADRYQTPAELVAALSAVLAGKALPDLNPSRKKVRIRRLVVAGLALAVVIGLAAALWPARARPTLMSGAVVTEEDWAAAGGLDGLVAVFGDGRLRQWGAWNGFALSPDGQFLVTTGGEQNARLWDGRKGMPRGLIPGLLARPQFSSDGRFLGGIGAGDTLFLWDTKTGKPVPAPSGRILGYSANLTMAAYATADGKQVDFHDLVAHKNRGRLDRHTRPLRCVAFSADGHWPRPAETTPSCWSAKLPREKSCATLAINAPKFPVTSLGLSPDGKTVCSWSSNWAHGELRLWDVPTATLLQFFGDARPWAFAPDGRTVAGRRQEGIRLWDVAAGKDRAILRSNAWRGTAAFSPDNRLVAAGMFNGKWALKFWDAATGDERTSFQGNPGSIAALSFSGDGQALATASDEGRCRLWDTATGRERLKTHDWPEWFTNAAFQPDGRTLALVDRDSVRLWNTRTGQSSTITPGHSLHGLRGARFSPDGQVLATFDDESVKLWNLPGGLPRCTVDLKDVLAMEFSSDGKFLATGASRAIRLWQTSTGQALSALPDMPADVVSVAFDPKSKWVAGQCEREHRSLRSGKHPSEDLHRLDWESAASFSPPTVSCVAVATMAPLKSGTWPRTRLSPRFLWRALPVGSFLRMVERWRSPASTAACGSGMSPAARPPQMQREARLVLLAYAAGWPLLGFRGGRRPNHRVAARVGRAENPRMEIVWPGKASLLCSGQSSPSHRQRQWHCLSPPHRIDEAEVANPTVVSSENAYGQKTRPMVKIVGNQALDITGVANFGRRPGGGGMDRGAKSGRFRSRAQR